MVDRQSTLLGVRIHDLPMERALKLSQEFLDSSKFHQVVTVGPEFLLEATAHEKFKKILNQSDLNLPEGIGLKVGSRLIGKSIKHRVPGFDYILGLLKLAQATGARVFLYGGRHEVVHQAAQEIIKAYPGLAIVGVESGWRGPWQQLQTHRVIEKIHRRRPDILLVALGAPKQELWIDHHRQALHQVKIAIGVGRSFDYLAGKIKRAPVWMRGLGLEWLHTWLFANQYHQPKLRRRRVQNATWNFLVHLCRHEKN